MHETIEISPVDDAAEFVTDEKMRSRAGDWIDRLERIDREVGMFHGYLPKDDEASEWSLRVHQRLEDSWPVST